jgi:hypothetical protein
MPQPRHVRITAALTQGRGMGLAADARPGPTQTLEMEAFLTPDGQMDAANRRRQQPVRALQEGHEIWSGRLVAIDQGWALTAASGEDAPLWYLTAQRLRPGEHLTLHTPNGDALVFRVVNVTAVDA